jgi:guanylate cyclase
VRIGIDTGPVVAGVIGSAKFIYDLWGDTVNTASRMESHASPGTIQVTERTHECLRHSFELSRRGSIDVKGKGPMTSYVLIGPRAGHTPRGPTGNQDVEASPSGSPSER